MKLHVEHFYPPLNEAKNAACFILQWSSFLYITKKATAFNKRHKIWRRDFLWGSELLWFEFFKVLKRFSPLTWNVKPHKVLWTSRVAVVLHGRGVFTMRSLFVSSGWKGISRRTKSPGPLKTWTGLSRRWTSWRGCEFAISHVSTLKMWCNKFNKWSWSWRFFLPL